MKKSIVFAFAAAFVVVMAGCQKDINSAAERDVQTSKSGNATIWVQNIQLSGLNEVPTNDFGATGVAILRLTADSVLHSKVIVNAPDSAGTLVAAHIHEGAVGANGPVRIFLAHDAEEFGVNQELKLSPAQFALLLNESASLYVNAHSTVKPAGLLRGQIR